MSADTPPLLGTHSRLDRLFLHFFDIHFIEDRGRAAETKQFRNEMHLATRLAVASADTVFIPAASYFESSSCREIIDSMDELVSLGLIVLSGSSSNLDEFIRERLDETFYRQGSSQYDSYRLRREGEVIPPYMPRSRSATRDIIDHWGQKVSNEDLARMLRDAAGSSIHELEGRLERVPKELGGLAFVPEHVYDILDLGRGASIVHSRIRSVINEGYFASYVRDLKAGVIIDLKYLASDFQLPSRGRNLSYTKMVRFLQGHGRLKELAECGQSQLVRLGDDPAWQQALESAVTYVGGLAPDGAANPKEAQQSMLQAVSQETASVSTLGGPQANGSSGGLGGSNGRYSVLCVVAAAVEFAAVQAHLEKFFGTGKIVHLDDARTEYAVRFADPEVGTVWHLAGLSFQGEVDAAVGAGKLTNMLQPTVILMVGMCMGMPKRQLPVGTVVVPNEVISFDHQRLTTSGTQYRPHGHRVDNGLFRLARVISSNSDLGYRVVADKGLASATIKIEDVQSDLVLRIESSFPDAAAFDMEGWGFYRGVDGRQCLWIKAVADSGERQSALVGAREDKHNTQAKATHHATDFAVRLVREFVRAERAGSI